MSGVLRAFTIGLTAFLTVVDLFATQAILPAKNERGYSERKCSAKANKSSTMTSGRNARNAFVSWTP